MFKNSQLKKELLALTQENEELRVQIISLKSELHEKCNYCGTLKSSKSILNENTLKTELTNIMQNLIAIQKNIENNLHCSEKVSTQAKETSTKIQKLNSISNELLKVISAIAKSSMNSRNVAENFYQSVDEISNVINLINDISIVINDFKQTEEASKKLFELLDKMLQEKLK
jgi:methyl-accepting chemotaxis protein